MFNVGDYIFDSQNRLGIILFVDKGTSVPYFIQYLDNSFEETNSFSISIWRNTFSELPKEMSEFSKFCAWEKDLTITLYQPKVGDYVTITKSDEAWLREMDKYVDQTFRIKKIDLSDDTLFEDAPSEIEEYAWEYNSGHYRPATKSEIEACKKSSSLSFPSEGKICGSIEEIEYVMAYLRASGRSFGSSTTHYEHNNFQAIAWNCNSLWLVMNPERSTKPEISFKQFQELKRNNPIEKDIPIGVKDLIVPEEWEVFRSFLDLRGGDRLCREFLGLLKKSDISSVPMTNIVFQSITWDKAITFVDWAIIDRDWKKYYCEYKDKHLIEESKKDKRRLLDEPFESNFDFDIRTADHYLGSLYNKEKTISFDIETAGLPVTPKQEPQGLELLSHIRSIKNKFTKKIRI